MRGARKRGHTANIAVFFARPFELSATRLAPDDLRAGAGPVLRRGRREGDVAADQRRQRLFRLEAGERVVSVAHLAETADDAGNGADGEEDGPSGDEPTSGEQT